MFRYVRERIGKVRQARYGEVGVRGVRQDTAGKARWIEFRFGELGNGPVRQAW